MSDTHKTPLLIVREIYYYACKHGKKEAAKKYDTSVHSLNQRFKRFGFVIPRSITRSSDKPLSGVK